MERSKLRSGAATRADCNNAEASDGRVRMAAAKQAARRGEELCRTVLLTVDSLVAKKLVRDE